MYFDHGVAGITKYLYLASTVTADVFWFFRQNLPLWIVKVDRVPLKKKKKIVYRPTVTGFRQSSIYTFI